jgi:hypothetical protein
LAPGKKFFVSQVMARKYHARVRPPAPKAQKDIKQASDDEPDEGIDEELKETLRQKKWLSRELAARRGRASRSARLAQESASRLGDFKALLDEAVGPAECLDIPDRSANICTVFAQQAREFADFLHQWREAESGP